jgi:hypothetical protein
VEERAGPGGGEGEEAERAQVAAGHGDCRLARVSRWDLSRTLGVLDSGAGEMERVVLLGEGLHF